MENVRGQRLSGAFLSPCAMQTVKQTFPEPVRPSLNQVHEKKDKLGHTAASNSPKNKNPLEAWSGKRNIT